MKNTKSIFYLLTFLLCSFCVDVWAQSTKSYEVALAGNAFQIGGNHGKSRIGRETAFIAASDSRNTNTYFKVLGKGDLQIKLRGRKAGPSIAKLEIVFLKNKRQAVIDKDGFTDIDLGTFKIKEPGYHHLDLKGMEGEAEVSHIIVSGSAVEEGLIFSDDPSFYYWSRRGPSCHMGYEVPENETVRYYYNEMQIPVGEDKIGSYFMAVGFAQGYFGIQVNSASERRVLFSVWSPFETDDPKSIPEDHKIRLLKKGVAVHTGEFGNEGSGGQSYLKYNWKAGNTYRFLLKGSPDGSGNTDFTAWFFAPEVNDWKLIASFKRPQTDSHLKRFHSFLENFDPNQGYLGRKVVYKNQWYYADNAWKPIERARFTVDNTYTQKQRIDATGGVTKDGFYLQNGGFFNNIVSPGSKFDAIKKGEVPVIDFDKLP